MFSLLSFWDHHHEGVADVLNKEALYEEARDVCLGGRAEAPLCRSRRERRLSKDKRLGGECWRKIGAPGKFGSSGGSKGWGSGATLERSAVGSVTRVMLRRKNGEPDSGTDGGTVLGGGLRAEGESVGRVEVRASWRFCIGEVEGEIDRAPDDCGESEEGEESFWPTQRRTG
jgi:hypothetical protein